MNNTEKLLRFIDASPSCFHAVAEAGAALREAGFTEIGETSSPKLERGGKYYVTRNQSSLIAFRIPEDAPTGFMICAAHSDSPCFKIKRNPEIDGGSYIKINAERYGGMIYSSWLDRPLGVAGRIVYSDGGRIKSKLVASDVDMLLIPNVAIHMNRAVNDGFQYNPAVDLVPLYSSAAGKGSFLKKIAELAGVDESDILDFDLYLTNRQKGFFFGDGGEFFSAPRIDDLQCAFSALKAIISADKSSAVPIFALFDNEEVGSLTRQGADSTFLYDILGKIASSLGKADSLEALLASSLMLSADNAHALHPNHPEYADPTHRPTMNGGVVIKYNASQLYTTSAISSAVFTEICRRAGVKTQYFANRSDMRGGSTLGCISSAHVSIPSVDIGCAQLAMHSAFETAGSRDTDIMTDAVKAFFSTEIISTADGEYEIK